MDMPDMNSRNDEILNNFDSSRQEESIPCQNDGFLPELTEDNSEHLGNADLGVQFKQMEGLIKMFGPTLLKKFIDFDIPIAQNVLFWSSLNTIVKDAFGEQESLIPNQAAETVFDFLDQIESNKVTFGDFLSGKQTFPKAIEYIISEGFDKLIKIVAKM